MGKDPALLFYVSDFLTGTMFMSNEQVGIYIRLLCSQHQHGGFIEKTAFNSLVGDNAIIRTKFIESEDGFYNKRLMEEMGKRSQKSSNLSANARKRWEKEYKGNAIAKQLVMQTENEDEDRNTNTNTEKKVKVVKGGTGGRFEEWWLLYPLRGGKRVGKAEAKKKFEAFKDSEVDQLFVALKHYSNSQTVKDGFAKDAKRFLSNEFWKDWLDGPGEVSSGNGMLSKAGEQSMKNAEIAFRDLRQGEQK